MLSIGAARADPSLEMSGHAGGGRGGDEGSRPGISAADLQASAPQLHGGVEVRVEGEPLRQRPVESHARPGSDEQRRGRARLVVEDGASAPASREADKTRPRRPTNAAPPSAGPGSRPTLPIASSPRSMRSAGDGAGAGAGA